MSEIISVKKILIDYLKANGFDGLCNCGLCSCKLDDFEPCDSINIHDCTAGYITDCKDCDEKKPDCGFEFCLTPEKPKTPEQIIDANIRVDLLSIARKCKDEGCTSDIAVKELNERLYELSGWSNYMFKTNSTIYNIKKIISEVYDDKK